MSKFIKIINMTLATIEWQFSRKSSKNQLSNFHGGQRSKCSHKQHQIRGGARKVPTGGADASDGGLTILVPEPWNQTDATRIRNRTVSTLFAMLCNSYAISKSKKVTSLNQRKKIVLKFAPTNWLFRSDGGGASLLRRGGCSPPSPPLAPPLHQIQKS